jgi:hypothetical protein
MEQGNEPGAPWLFRMLFRVGRLIEAMDAYRSFNG